MDVDPQEQQGASRGNESHRRPRAVHKVRMTDLEGLTDAEIATMVGSGDIELLVRRSEIGDGQEGSWTRQVAPLLDKVARGLDRVPEHENRTIIINIVAVRPTM